MITHFASDTHLLIMSTNSSQFPSLPPASNAISAHLAECLECPVTFAALLP